LFFGCFCRDDTPRIPGAAGGPCGSTAEGRPLTLPPGLIHGRLVNTIKVFPYVIHVIED